MAKSVISQKFSKSGRAKLAQKKPTAPPAANTLLDFFPAPPWHIPYLALITVILFTAIYLPFKYLNSYKQTSF